MGSLQLKVIKDFGFFENHIRGILETQGHEFSFFSYLEELKRSRKFSVVEYWLMVISNNFLGFDELLRVLKTCPDWRIYVAVLKLFVRLQVESKKSAGASGIEYVEVEVLRTRQPKKKKEEKKKEVAKVDGVIEENELKKEEKKEDKKKKEVIEEPELSKMVSLKEFLETAFISPLKTPCGTSLNYFDSKMDGGWRVLNALGVILCRLPECRNDRDLFNNISCYSCSATFRESVSIRFGNTGCGVGNDFVPKSEFGVNFSGANSA